MLALTIKKKEMVVITTESGEVVKFKISDKDKKTKQMTLVFNAKAEIKIKRALIKEKEEA